MGTNIYVKTPPCPNACEHCAAAQTIHLGKFSAGWTFLYRATPEGVHRSYEDWLNLAKSGQIEDEYGEPLTLDELLARIRGRTDLQRHNHQGIVHDETGRDWACHEFS